jgi:hypothetical protein
LERRRRSCGTGRGSRQARFWLAGVISVIRVYQWWGFAFPDHKITRCPDHPILVAYPLPYPSQIGVDFSGVIPRSSQIGVHLRHMGTVWRMVEPDLVSNYPITKLPTYPILPLEHGRWTQLQLFVLSKSPVKHRTLGRCQTIAIFFAHINSELVHLDKSVPQKHMVSWAFSAGCQISGLLGGAAKGTRSPQLNIYSGCIQTKSKHRKTHSVLATNFIISHTLSAHMKERFSG